MKTYNKLVRDKIPNIIKKDGVKSKFHVADEKEYRQKLNEKLREEVEELIAKPCAEEIADVLEVIETIANLNGIGLDEIKEQKITKKSLRGGFSKKIILETTDEK
jgi:predicted house-cleaning noncanonical NTP pyrophosphatase (MazG superfamily)